jgi:rubredoxin
MKNLIRCKACGYIIEANKLGDRCPACGVPKTGFEPYADNVSSSRRRILNLFLHPISVHFPQAFAVLLVFLHVATLLPHGILRNTMFSGIKVLAFFLPFSVIAAFFTGLVDGKLRFKKLSPPHLKRKIFVGTLFIIFSSALFLSSFLCEPETGAVWGILLGCACILCSMLLGKTGEKLMYAIMPGDMKIFGWKL